MPTLNCILLAQESFLHICEGVLKQLSRLTGRSVCIIVDSELGKKRQPLLRLGSVLTSALEVCPLPRDSQQLSGKLLLSPCTDEEMERGAARAQVGVWAVKPTRCVPK